MTLINRALPQPLTSVAILGLWVALASSISLGNIMLGLLVAFAIPLFTQRFWPDRPKLARPFLGLRFFALVVFDIITANIHVARLVLGPTERLRPDLVEFPLAIKDPFVATLLGSVISLTPGTVSIEIDVEKDVLLIHALDVPDKAALIAEIKQRYEAPLKEIFQC